MYKSDASGVGFPLIPPLLACCATVAAARPVPAPFSEGCNDKNRVPVTVNACLPAPAPRDDSKFSRYRVQSVILCFKTVFHTSQGFNLPSKLRGICHSETAQTLDYVTEHDTQTTPHTLQSTRTPSTESQETTYRSRAPPGHSIIVRTVKIQ